MAKQAQTLRHCATTNTQAVAKQALRHCTWTGKWAEVKWSYVKAVQLVAS